MAAMTPPQEPLTLLEELERFEASLVHGLVRLLRLERLLRRFLARPVWAAFMFVGCG